jgi:hypothetical protein
VLYVSYETPAVNEGYFYEQTEALDLDLLFLVSHKSQIKLWDE